MTDAFEKPQIPGGTPVPSIDTLQFFVAAADNLIYLINNCGSSRPTSEVWKAGYQTALADLRGSEELRILQERSAELGKLLGMQLALGGGSR